MIIWHDQKSRSGEKNKLYDSRQIEAKLGIKRADKLFGVDFKAYSEGKQKEMLICFNQIYYTARVEPLTASSLFKDEVTPDDLRENGAVISS